jgi:hypothetical protein
MAVAELNRKSLKRYEGGSQCLPTGEIVEWLKR